MSSYSYVCRGCGALRRRPQVVWRPGCPAPASYPRCHDQPMTLVRKAHAEAATKLTRSERVTWLALGGHVFRRPGRRWTAALTEGQMARARQQVADLQASHDRISRRAGGARPRAWARS